MAKQFDVCRVASRSPNMAVVMQHDSLSHLSTRVIAPLVGLNEVPRTVDHHSPRVQTPDGVFVVALHLLMTVSKRALSPPIYSLDHESYRLKRGLDALYAGI